MAELSTIPGFSLPEIEQSALSCLMNQPEQCWTLCEARGIKPEHFQTPANRVLFGTLQHFWKEGHSYDVIAFTNQLRRLELLATIGGAFYITQTWVNPECLWPTADMLEYYLGLIEEQHAKRLLFQTCGEAKKESQQSFVEGEELVQRTIQELAEIPLPSRHRQGEYDFAEAIEKRVGEIATGKLASDILLTGLADLDEKSPMRAGAMPLIAGERKAGKSILALSIALNVARRGVGVLYFALENPQNEIIDRALCNIARSRDKEKLVEAGRTLALQPFYFRDDLRELPQICACIREFKARKNIGLVVVDYAQLVRVPALAKITNPEQIVAEVSRSFRELALELLVPVIVLCQLNQEGFTRWSRSLEQDCTAMWRIDRKDDEPNVRGLAIPFQRDGESGVGFKVTFLGEIARVENYYKEE